MGKRRKSESENCNLRRTVVKLEIRTDEATLEQLEPHIAPLRGVDGVEAIAIEMQPQWYRFNMIITITGSSSKRLQRIYGKVCELANVRPLILTGRTCNLVEMFSDLPSSTF